MRFRFYGDLQDLPSSYSLSAIYRKQQASNNGGEIYSIYVCEM
jgi:hypothetical protein